MRQKKLQNTFLICAFALILALPVLDEIFNFSPVKELFEKRIPTPKPDFPKGLKALKDYPQNFEKFFNDNYGFRKSLISLHSHMMDKVFDESPDARAVVGKDDWLYFDNYNSLLDAAGRATLDEGLVERGVKSFGENWRKMREKNIKYLVVIAADKSSIYPEFLPSYIKPLDAPPSSRNSSLRDERKTSSLNGGEGSHRIDKFLTALLKKYPDFPILDLRPILKKAKETEIVYQKTDTHWNRRGAHYAYVEMMKKLGIKPHLRHEFANKEDEMIKGDISDIMNLDIKNLNYDLTAKFKISSHQVNVSEAEKQRFHNPVFYENSNKNLPVLFAYKDSFFGDLFEFVNEHFSRNFAVNESPCDLDYEVFNTYGPDVVIHQFWEGRIEAILGRCK